MIPLTCEPLETPNKCFKYPISWSPDNTSINDDGIVIYCPNADSICVVQARKGQVSEIFYSIEEAEEKLGCLKELTKEQLRAYSHRLKGQ